MREINHDTLSYGGEPNEQVNIRVEPQGTPHSVTYVLDGTGPTVLPAGKKLPFNLKSAAGASTILQLNLEYIADGTYKVTVENVSGCPKDLQGKNECSHTYDDFPDGNTLDFSFFAE